MERPAVYALVTRSQGIYSRCSSSRSRRMGCCARGRAYWELRLPSPSGLARPLGSPALALQVSRVADRPLALHTEAPNRCGHGTRLALPTPVEVITRIAGRLSP